MKIGKHELADRAVIMGILNVTPDSFSDGGQYVSVGQALKQTEEMLAAGAKIIDVGGESTRPGAVFVSAEDEIKRTVPIIKAIKERFDCLVSIDTYKTETAQAALEAGADILNDVWSGLYDGRMFDLAAQKDVPIILMHNQTEEVYSHVTQDVSRFLLERAALAQKAGVKKENIWLDPGFGFAKNIEQNLELLKGLDQITSLGYPVLFGISRKRIVDSMLGGNTKPQERDMATAALSAYAIGKGCQIVRVHNVPANKDIVKVTSQLM
ncbi:dihydropteroate synthase [Streptococcus ratti]|uniref:Dihydropteroate synthase n=1 Tax=Streptococcus ratti FA-1 = DSM 20564 TaxID=699248 RepID=A0ABN0GUB1_STRRT|nr:dihydropteroate synthase [Streptococcus ratti]EJN93840.1 dihydropteroate synthase [Streptococcus ratti FA-1 = DSM 20564]EMP69112.1 dihydropteroate synthase [Streptococcus ratti FA-1 = DSM 20564]QEY07688.1 dihydropteroate synthase [Streptococcus ratti]VEI60149.1 dihydropteroate synthase [Streptococcus mutans]